MNPDDPRSVPEAVDIITAVNDTTLSGIDALVSYLAANTEPGQSVTLTVLRLNGETSEELRLEARLTPRP